MKRNILCKIKNIIKFFYKWLITRPKLICKLLLCKKYYVAESYYPEMKRKSKLNIVFDQLWHILKYARLNEFYFVLGFDIKGLRKQEDYYSVDVFHDHINRLNSPKGESFSYISLLRDKFYFNLIFESLGFYTTSIVGIINKGEFFLYKTKQWTNIKDFLQNSSFDLFCKPVDSLCGRGIFSLKCNSNIVYINDLKSTINDVVALFNENLWIMEERVIQHPDIAKYHPKSVNTLRLVTVRDINSGEIHSLPSAIRIGTGESIVDNWAFGGLIVGISDDGKLKKYGFYKQGVGTKLEKHPDSEIVFKGQIIPMYKESVQMVCKMHQFLPGLHSIGWDIAITENGPIVIEGNDNWDTAIPQIVGRGLKDDFMKYSTLK